MNHRRWTGAAGPLLLIVISMAIVLVSTSASAEVRRYALVIGTNLGEPEEVELRYAERDARRVADVLGRLGQVSEENRVLLLDADANAVERVMKDLGDRISAFEASNPNSETLLFVFYSGHADATSMHLRGTRLTFERVKGLLDASPADLKVFVIDACRSGDLTRVKGAAPAPPFKIDTGGRLAGEGMAIITSSAAGEDAQESERLGGSFFTHHFVSGLLGAADVSGDRRVTLGEVYQYAYQETLRSTSQARFVQHPTYAFQIRGRQDVILTSLEGRSRGAGRMEMIDPGLYMVFGGSDEGPLVAEVTVDDRSEVMLEPGRYLIRHRSGGSVHQMLTHVVEGQTITVAVDEMQWVPYAKMVRKGLGGPAQTTALGISTGAGVSGALVSGTGPLIFGTVGAQLDLEPITLQSRFRAGLSQRNNGFIEIEQRVLGLDIGALKLFDLGDFSLGLGMRIGGDMVFQSFESDGVAPSRQSLVWRGTALGHVAWTPLPWLSFFMEGGGEAFLAQVERDSGARYGARLAPYGMAGAVIYAY